MDNVGFIYEYLEKYEKVLNRHVNRLRNRKETVRLTLYSAIY